MLKILFTNLLPTVLYISLTTIFAFISNTLNKFLKQKKEILELEKKKLIQTIGINQYDKDLSYAIQAIHAVEQLGKEFDWDGLIKHSKATEIILKNTGLTEDEIFQIIKATVSMLRQ